MGERYNLSDGTEIVHRMMGVNGDKVWIELSKNGTVQYSHILHEGEYFIYEDADI
ncbi:MAG: hypothetical protein K8R25_13370 [Methanosarcinales archaeon]|nr:hypothetical protein [Methanosarcinales archaeon]